jgi:pimeloyl-ACP methyl ester carboxylesterase
MNEPSVGGAGGFADGLGHRGMSVRDTSELRVATLEMRRRTWRTARGSTPRSSTATSSWPRLACICRFGGHVAPRFYSVAEHALLVAALVALEHPDDDALIAVPKGGSIFPHELQRPSRRWAARRFTDIRHWNELDRGGHFAPLEQPELFVDELRRFFRLVRGTA